MLYGQSTFFCLRFVILKIANDGNGGSRQCALYTHNKQRRKSHGWPQRAILGFLSALLCCLAAWLGGLSNISKGQCVPGTPLPISAFSIFWCLHYPPIPLPRSSPRSQVYAVRCGISFRWSSLRLHHSPDRRCKPSSPHRRFAGHSGNSRSWGTIR